MDCWWAQVDSISGDRRLALRPVEGKGVLLVESVCVLGDDAMVGRHGRRSVSEQLSVKDAW